MTKGEFLEGIGNWSNHRYLLWPALEATKGTVIEFGAGEGSTKYLRRYCSDADRVFLSFENNEKYAKENSSIFINDWDNVKIKDVDVLLIDHAPGERRHIDIEKYKDVAKILVIHDSEPAATGYLLDKIWHLFKYRIDYKTSGAWATAVSNSIDVAKFADNINFNP